RLPNLLLELGEYLSGRLFKTLVVEYLVNLFGDIFLSHSFYVVHNIMKRDFQIMYNNIRYTFCLPFFEPLVNDPHAMFGGPPAELWNIISHEAPVPRFGQSRFSQ